MSLGTLILIIIAILCIISIPVYLVVRSSQKTRREYAQQRQNTQTMSEMAQPDYSPKPSFAQNAPSMGIAVIGFFIPLVGIIMYIAWLNSLPFRARSAGKGALAGVIVYLVCSAVIVAYIMGGFS